MANPHDYSSYLAGTGGQGSSDQYYYGATLGTGGTGENDENVGATSAGAGWGADGTGGAASAAALSGLTQSLPFGQDHQTNLYQQSFGHQHDGTGVSQYAQDYENLTSSLTGGRAGASGGAASWLMAMAGAGATDPSSAAAAANLAAAAAGGGFTGAHASLLNQFGGYGAGAGAGGDQNFYGGGGGDGGETSQSYGGETSQSYGGETLRKYGEETSQKFAEETYQKYGGETSQSYGGPRQDTSPYDDVGASGGYQRDSPQESQQKQQQEDAWNMTGGGTTGDATAEEDEEKQYNDNRYNPTGYDASSGYDDSGYGASSGGGTYEPTPAAAAATSAREPSPQGDAGGGNDMMSAITAAVATASSSTEPTSSSAPKTKPKRGQSMTPSAIRQRERRAQKKKEKEAREAAAAAAASKAAEGASASAANESMNPSASVGYSGFGAADSSWQGAQNSSAESANAASEAMMAMHDQQQHRALQETAALPKKRGRPFKKQPLEDGPADEPWDESQEDEDTLQPRPQKGQQENDRQEEAVEDSAYKMYTSGVSNESSAAMWGMPSGMSAGTVMGMTPSATSDSASGGKKKKKRGPPKKVADMTDADVAESIMMGKTPAEAMASLVKAAGQGAMGLSSISAGASSVEEKLLHEMPKKPTDDIKTSTTMPNDAQKDAVKAVLKKDASKKTMPEKVQKEEEKHKPEKPAAPPPEPEPKTTLEKIAAAMKAAEKAEAEGNNADAGKDPKAPKKNAIITPEISLSCFKKQTPHLANSLAKARSPYLTGPEKPRTSPPPAPTLPPGVVGHLVASMPPPNFPPSMIYRAMGSYSLLRTLSLRLRLSPFTPTAFLNALLLKVPNPLLGEIHVRVLRMLFAHRKIGSYHLRGSPKHHHGTVLDEASRKRQLGCDNLHYLDLVTWPVYYEEYVRTTEEGFRDSLEDEEPHYDGRSFLLREGSGVGDEVMYPPLPNGMCFPAPPKPPQPAMKSYGSHVPPMQPYYGGAPPPWAYGGGPGMPMPPHQAPYQPYPPPAPYLMHPPSQSYPYGQMPQTAGYGAPPPPPQPYGYPPYQPPPPTLGQSVGPEIAPQVAATAAAARTRRKHLLPTRIVQQSPGEKSPPSTSSTTAPSTKSPKPKRKKAVGTKPATTVRSKPGITSEDSGSETESEEDEDFKVDDSEEEEDDEYKPRKKSRSKVTKKSTPSPPVKVVSAAPGSLVEDLQLAKKVPITSAKELLKSAKKSLKEAVISACKKETEDPTSKKRKAPVASKAEKKSSSAKVSKKTSGKLTPAKASALGKKKRGRPPKSSTSTLSPKKTAVASPGSGPPKKKRGRPSKKDVIPVASPVGPKKQASATFSVAVSSAAQIAPFSGPGPHGQYPAYNSYGAMLPGTAPGAAISVAPPPTLGQQHTPVGNNTTPQEPSASKPVEDSEPPPLPAPVKPPPPAPPAKQNWCLQVDDGEVCNELQKFVVAGPNPPPVEVEKAVLDKTKLLVVGEGPSSQEKAGTPSCTEGMSQAATTAMQVENAENTENIVGKVEKSDLNRKAENTAITNCADEVTSTGGSPQGEKAEKMNLKVVDDWRQTSYAFDSNVKTVPHAIPLQKIRSGVPYGRLSLNHKLTMLEYLLDELLVVDTVSAELSKRRHVTDCFNGPYGDLPTKKELADLVNVDECVVCGMEGELICCDGCTASLHRRCIDIPFNKELPDRWLCVECRIADSGKMGPLRGGRKCEIDWFTLQLLGHDKLPLSADAKDAISQGPAKEGGDVPMPDAASDDRIKVEMGQKSEDMVDNTMPSLESTSDNTANILQGEVASKSGGDVHIRDVDSSVAQPLEKALSPEEKKRKDFFERCKNIEFMVVHGFVFTRNCKTKEPCAPFRTRTTEKNSSKKDGKKDIEPLTPEEVLKLLKLLGPYVCAKWPWRQIPYDPSQVWSGDWDKIKALEEKDVVLKRNSPVKDKVSEPKKDLDVNKAHDPTIGQAIVQETKATDEKSAPAVGTLMPIEQDPPLKPPSLALLEKQEAFNDYFKSPESYSPISYINHYRWAPVPRIQKSHQGSYVSTSYRTLYTENLTWSSMDVRNNFRKETSGNIDLSYVLKVQSSLHHYNPMQPIREYMLKLEKQLSRACLLDERWGTRNRQLLYNIWARNVTKAKSVKRLAHLLIVLIDATHSRAFHDEWNKLPGKGARGGDGIDAMVGKMGHHHRDDRSYKPLPSNWTPMNELRRRKWERSSITDMLSLMVKESGGLEGLFHKGDTDGAVSSIKNRKKRKLIHTKVFLPLNHQSTSETTSATPNEKSSVDASTGNPSASPTLSEESKGQHFERPAPAQEACPPAKKPKVNEPETAEVAPVLQSMTEKAPEVDDSPAPKPTKPPPPPPPVRNKSAFLHFSHTKSGEMKDQKGKGKKISSMWKEISPEERSKWEKIAKDDKKRYLAEKAEFKKRMKALGLDFQAALSGKKKESKVSFQSNDKDGSDEDRSGSRRRSGRFQSRSAVHDELDTIVSSAAPEIQSEKIGLSPTSGLFSGSKGDPAMPNTSEYLMNKEKQHKIAQLEKLLSTSYGKEIQWPAAGRKLFDPEGCLSTNMVKWLGRNAGSKIAPFLTYSAKFEVGQAAVCHVWRKKMLSCSSFEEMMLNLRFLDSHLNKPTINSCETLARRSNAAKALIQKVIRCSHRDPATGQMEYLIVNQGKSRGCWLLEDSVDQSALILDRSNHIEAQKLKFAQLLAEKRRKEADDNRKKKAEAARRKAEEEKKKREQRRRAEDERRREKAKNAAAQARNSAARAAAQSQKHGKDDTASVSSGAGKRRGRPKGSKNKAKDFTSMDKMETNGMPDMDEVLEESEKNGKENPGLRKYSMDFQMAIVRHQNDTKRLLKESAAKGLPTVPTEMMNPARLQHMNEMKAANEALRREGGEYFDNSELTQKLSHAEAVAVRLYVEEAKQEARRSSKQESKAVHKAEKKTDSNELELDAASSEQAELPKPKKGRKPRASTKKGPRKQGKKKTPTEPQESLEPDVGSAKQDVAVEREATGRNDFTGVSAQDTQFDSNRFADTSETTVEENVNQTEASPWMPGRMVDQQQQQQEEMDTSGPVPIREDVNQQKNSSPYGDEAEAGASYSMQQYGINDASLQRDQLGQGSLLRSSALAGLATGADGSLMGSSNMSQQQQFLSGTHGAPLSQIEQNLRLPMQQTFGTNLYQDHARQQNLPLGQYTSAIQDLISGAGQGQLHQQLLQSGGIQADPMDILNRNQGLDFVDGNAIDPTTGASIKQQQGYDHQGQMGFQMSNPSSRHTQQLQSQLSDQYGISGSAFAAESSLMGQRAGAASYLQDRALEQNFGAQAVLQDLEPRPIGNVDPGRGYNAEQALLQQGTNPNNYVGGNASLYFSQYHNN